MKPEDPNYYKPLLQERDVTKLLNRSKLVEGWLLCNKSKKPKLHIHCKVISMDLGISTELHTETVSKSQEMNNLSNHMLQHHSREVSAIS